MAATSVRPTMPPGHRKNAYLLCPARRKVQVRSGNVKHDALCLPADRHHPNPFAAEDFPSANARRLIPLAGRCHLGITSRVWQKRSSALWLKVIFGHRPWNALQAVLTHPSYASPHGWQLSRHLEPFPLTSLKKAEERRRPCCDAWPEVWRSPPLPQ